MLREMIGEAFPELEEEVRRGEPVGKDEGGEVGGEVKMEE
jgi:hypothetical protein